MATHSSIFAWRISLTEEPNRHSLESHKELDATEHACAHTWFINSISCFVDIAFCRICVIITILLIHIAHTEVNKHLRIT